MKHKEKALELVNKYLQIYDGRVVEAKKCALIAVDEILDTLSDILEITASSSVIENIKYWEKVIEEIDNL